MCQFYDVSASCADVCVLFRTYTFVLIKRMRQFYDVSASCADVCVLFRTYTFVLINKVVCLSYVYINIDTHALCYSSACVNFMMYRLLVLTFAFCFERIRLF